MIDESTAKLLADKGVWWSLQPLTYDAEVFARMNPVSQTKALEVLAVSAASTITNYALNIAESPLEPMFQEHAWRRDSDAPTQSATR